MYSYEERINAAKLYEKYGKRAAAVIRELGYPDRHIHAKWYQENISEGTLNRISLFQLVSRPCPCYTR